MDTHKIVDPASNLEVAIGVAPEQVVTSNLHLEGKFLHGSHDERNLQQNISQKPNQPVRPNKVRFWILGILAVLIVAGALGAGLGAGLTIHRRNPSEV